MLLLRSLNKEEKCALNSEQAKSHLQVLTQYTGEWEGRGIGNWPACHLAHAEQRQVMNGRHSQSSLSYCSHNDNCRHRHSAHCTAHRHFATLKWQELLAKEQQIETAA